MKEINVAVAFSGCGNTVTLGVQNSPDNERTSQQPAFRFSAPVLAEETRLDPVP